jgi:hypothetical protein
MSNTLVELKKFKYLFILKCSHFFVNLLLYQFKQETQFSARMIAE